MSGKKIKTIVADDSGFMRLLVSDMLTANDDIEVIDTAINGKEAFEKTCRLKPDVLVLDLNMDLYDGMYAIRHVMKECPTPIIILSSLGNNDMPKVIEGLELGAFDYVTKPVSNKNMRDIGFVLKTKIKYASEVELDVLLKKRSHNNNHSHSFVGSLNYDVIVIGSSTGGPTAVESVLTKLPENLPIPVLIAQHMPASFVYSFANRLNELVPLEIAVGNYGTVVEPGKIIIAPGDKNMIVKRGSNGGRVTIDFTDQQYSEFNDPSVDGLMLSVAECYGRKSIGVILTGMGQDGMEGMKKIKEKGGYTIAQSKQTCAVYGMPRAAVEAGCVNSIVNIEEIGGFIVSCLS